MFPVIRKASGAAHSAEPSFLGETGRLFTFTLATPDRDFSPHEDLSLTGVQIQQSGKRLSPPLAWDLERSGDLLLLPAVAPLSGSQKEHR